MTTATEMKERILSKATEDGDFRAHLIADPKAAISAEIGQDHTGWVRRDGTRGKRRDGAPGAASFAHADGGGIGASLRRRELDDSWFANESKYW